jgi:hypothetical protein
MGCHSHVIDMQCTCDAAPGSNRPCIKHRPRRMKAVERRAALHVTAHPVCLVLLHHIGRVVFGGSKTDYAFTTILGGRRRRRAPSRSLAGLPNLDNFRSRTRFSTHVSRIETLYTFLETGHQPTFHRTCFDWTHLPN